MNRLLCDFEVLCYDFFNSQNIIIVLVLIDKDNSNLGWDELKSSVRKEIIMSLWDEAISQAQTSGIVKFEDMMSHRQKGNG
jgi:hypothetical protein